MRCSKCQSTNVIEETGRCLNHSETQALTYLKTPEWLSLQDLDYTICDAIAKARALMMACMIDYKACGLPPMFTADVKMSMEWRSQLQAYGLRLWTGRELLRAPDATPSSSPDDAKPSAPDADTSTTAPRTSDKGLTPPAPAERMCSCPDASCPRCARVWFRRDFPASIDE